MDCRIKSGNDEMGFAFSRRLRARAVPTPFALSSLRGAKRRSNPGSAAQSLDCFAEPVIGPATSGRTRWLAMTKITGSGTPTDAVLHEPHQRVRRAPRRSRLAPTLRCGRARLSAFHHGACGSDRTPPLSFSSRASRDSVGAHGPDGSKDRAPFSAGVTRAFLSQSSEFQPADRSSCRPGVSRRSRPGAEVTSPARGNRSRPARRRHRRASCT